MLKRVVNKYAVESDEGFMVDRTGTSFTEAIMRYHEGPRVLELVLDYMEASAATPIEVKYITNWNPPYEKEALSIEKRVEIASRICDAMKFLGDKCYVV